MPTYQYACTECGHAFEQVQSFSDDALTTCPECQGRLRKVFNAVGVVFKGSGFYRTDSRKTADAASSSGSSSSDSSSSSSGASSEKSSSSSEKSSSSSSSEKSSSTSTKSTQPAAS
ncbi:FmdB family transcriptional regulator [Nocardioides anomalus]|uniref:FmdB family transcriptional regulator n=1 Tax=Nocardioides anomalus TaxID=2712223 RepID=A0A6G6W8C7_9ACTN|nr:FmdB family zinc ribbon protein [Nocardioides anomalus]QIG41472.1 FmdB family transcriptional regulator [Nocardioides anomalus]